MPVGTLGSVKGVRFEELEAPDLDASIILGNTYHLWLRPGLALSDLEQRRDKLAVACWAKDIQLAPASDRHAALIQVNVTARDALLAQVVSPLTTLLSLLSGFGTMPSKGENSSCI